MKIYHKWTDEEREVIRCGYCHTKRSKDELAARLGTTRQAVAAQVQLLGITRQVGRAWTDAEDRKLIKLLESHCPQYVAKMMHRSVSSVVSRSKRLGVRRRMRDSWFTEKDVGTILGHSCRWVRKRIDEGKLKATYHNGHHPSGKGLSMWHIEESDLREFIRTYPQELTGRNVDMIMLVDILAGVSDKNIER